MVAVIAYDEIQQGGMTTMSSGKLTENERRMREEMGLEVEPAPFVGAARDVQVEWEGKVPVRYNDPFTRGTESWWPRWTDRSDTVSALAGVSMARLGVVRVPMGVAGVSEIQAFLRSSTKRICPGIAEELRGLQELLRSMPDLRVPLPIAALGTRFSVADGGRVMEDILCLFPGSDGGLPLLRPRWVGFTLDGWSVVDRPNVIPEPWRILVRFQEER